MTKYIETTGKTEDLAIAAALEQLGMDRDDVSVEIIKIRYKRVCLIKQGSVNGNVCSRPADLSFKYFDASDVVKVAVKLECKALKLHFVVLDYIYVHSPKVGRKHKKARRKAKQNCNRQNNYLRFRIFLHFSSFL